MENSSAKRHYYQAYEMRHALSDIDVRLTALERGPEKPKQMPDDDLTHPTKSNCTFCSETRPHHHQSRGPGRHSKTIIDDDPSPKPAPATVERYDAFKFTHGTSCEAENHCWRDPIGEVVATRHGSTPTQCIEIVHNGKSEIFSPKQYEWIVEHLTSAGVWERKNDAENKRLRGLLERAFAWVYILRRDKTIYESGALDKLEEECGNVVREQLDSASKETI